MVHYKNLGLKNIRNEVWSNIIGFEGFYQVSNMGRVKSLERIGESEKLKRKIKKIILKQSFDGKGKYLFVCLYKNKSRTQLNVHRIVGIHFIPNPENKPEINHKKAIKYDNRATELEWSTVSENRLHAYRLGLIDKNKLRGMLGRFGNKHHNSKKVLQISMEGKVLNCFNGTREAMRETGINQSNISKVCKGKYPHTGGFKWEYKL